MSLGLIALMALNLPQPQSSIRILTDCQSLIITLSRGPARQSDSACTSISPLLHQQNPQHPHSVDSISYRHSWQHTCRPRGQARLHPSQTSVPVDLATAKALLRRKGQEEFHTRYTRDSHSATHRSLTGETGLAGPEASASPLASCEQATARFWPATSTASDENNLQCVLTAEAMRRRHSIFFFAARHTRRHVHLPTTSTQPILDADGPSWSRSGP